jgi:hypothetical protein
VDDGGIFCETREEIKEMIVKLSIHFVLKDLGNMGIFVGCRIIDTLLHSPAKTAKTFKARIWRIGRIT